MPVTSLINANKLCYRYASNALFHLKSHGEWEELWLLRDKDVCRLNEQVQTEEELWEQDHLRVLRVMDAIGESSSNWNLAQCGDNKRVMSWIWYELGNTNDNPATIEGNEVRSMSFGCLLKSSLHSPAY